VLLPVEPISGDDRRANKVSRARRYGFCGFIFGFFATLFCGLEISFGHPMGRRGTDHHGGPFLAVVKEHAHASRAPEGATSVGTVRHRAQRSSSLGKRGRYYGHYRHFLSTGQCTGNGAVLREKIKLSPKRHRNKNAPRNEPTEVGNRAGDKDRRCENSTTESGTVCPRSASSSCSRV
jgi:hypothetical protein